MRPVEAQDRQIVAPLRPENGLGGVLVGLGGTILRPLIQGRTKRLRQGERQVGCRQGVARHSVHGTVGADPTAQLELSPP
jgi:hypothetical protein